VFGKDNLIQKIENGDTTCLDEIINFYYSDIFKYCLWHTPNRQTAEDAVQETFLKMIRYFDKYIHRGKFKSYIYKIASNVCTDIWRKNSADSLPEDLPYMEYGFEKTEADIYLKYLVQNLSEKYREIVLLRFAQNLSMREISEIQNIPLRTVQSRLRTALKQLKKVLKKESKSYE
jgi:RNA polymerase sigma-70 factor (ECF subfamily)